MNQRQQNKEQINYFYQVVNASNDGSYYSNKEFHLIYHVYSYNFIQGIKKIIGILANKNDEDNFLFFRIIVPITQEFTISLLLRNSIYTSKYSKALMKKHLLEDYLQKDAMQYLNYVLKQKMELNP